MRSLLVSALLLSGLALAPAAGADGNGLEWRLDGRSEIWYRHPGERNWRRAPGSATDLGDGWVIGTDRRNGGYGIYRWNGYGWIRTPGAGIEIGGSYDNPWVVNDRGERFSWTGYSWREVPNRRNVRGNDRDDRGRRDNDWNSRRRDNDWNSRRRGDGFWDNDRNDEFWERDRRDDDRDDRDDRDGRRNRGNDRDR